MSAPAKFVAYAFSFGDAFFELDHSLVIRDVDGAAGWLGAQAAQSLIGISILDLFDEDDHGLLRRAVLNLSQTVRLGPLRMRCGLDPQDRRPVGLYLSALPDQSERIHIVVISQSRLGFPGDEPEPGEGISLEGFLGRLKDLAGNPDAASRPLLLSLIQLDEDQLSTPQERLVREMAALSPDGQSAGRLAEGRYALLHEARDSEQGASLLSQALSESTGENFQTASLPLQEMDFSNTDIARAVAYSIRKFADPAAEFDLKSFESQYRAEIAETQRRMLHFREIVRERRFGLVFQPVVTLLDRGLHHVEALTRFDPRAGQTGEMIGFAEDVDIITEFDLAVLKKVGAVLDKNAGAMPSKIAVNLSGRSLANPDFVRQLEALLTQSYGFGERLLFEVTESSQIPDLSAVNSVLHMLREAGHPVCLDDFGAGYSSYQYLRNLDVDYVKLDGSYVQQAVNEGTLRAFLHSMATLCRDLGIATIGECVESADQENLLAEIGVDYGQGFLFGRPQQTLPRSMRAPAAGPKDDASRQR